jgi:hypothetical protein
MHFFSPFDLVESTKNIDSSHQPIDPVTKNSLNGAILESKRELCAGFVCHSRESGNPGILDAGSSPARQAKSQCRFLSVAVPSS